MTTAIIWCNADTFKMEMIADVDFNSDASFDFFASYYDDNDDDDDDDDDEDDS